ncbi:MAG: hypothetical protein A2X47_11285 [Lentisphaerae bacterium GWF2_38_69]|nr:MAG: hypothetical protein A2X47_11285 [Lentisphaerae bacterium GWF2_38_69]
MTSLERTLKFIKGEKVDRPPFHPIIMRWAAKYAGVKYRDFCLDYKSKCRAAIKCAEDFSIDWVTVMSDPFAETEAYGLKCEYPQDNLPEPVEYPYNDVSEIDKIGVIKTHENARMLARVHEVEEFSRLCKDKYLIVGWVEGPMAEYADIRGFANACMDLYDAPDKIAKAAKIITANAIDFVTYQVKAGAHCIGIGEAACSQIGPELYKELFFELDKAIVNHIHSLGAIAKLHICGNTTAILPDMIATGADIIDVDHLVGSMKPFVHLLKPTQVVSGNSDPVSVIQDGTPETIRNSVIKCYEETGHRCIVSAGCEVPPGTTVENFKAFRDAALSLAGL